MEKKCSFLVWVLLSIFAISCTDVYKEDDSEEEEVIVPPGDTYTAEKETYCLNVVYYVPADVEDVEDWHYRLSGVPLHVQNYFYENFMRYRVDKKFGLELNDVNADFIRIHYIKSTRKLVEMQERNMSEMAQEVLGYFEQHPESKKSDHYLVWMPEYSGSFINFYYPSAKEGFAFAGVDNTRWKIRYFDSARARATFLSNLGTVLRVFAKSCFLPYSNAGLDSPFRALMGAEKALGASAMKAQPYFNSRNYAGWVTSSTGYMEGTPDKVRLMIWDIRYLAGTQLFNDDYSYEPFDVTVEDVKVLSKQGVLEYADDTLHVTCKFKCPVELAGVLMLDDPWRTYDPVFGKRDESIDKDEMQDTGWDAYGVYVEQASLEKEGDVYTASFVVPLCNHINFELSTNSSTLISHEIRFRFIGKNGMAFPHAPTSIKGGPCSAPLRTCYKLVRTRLGTGYPAVYYVLHDIPTKYGTWVSESE